MDGWIDGWNDMWSDETISIVIPHQLYHIYHISIEM